MQITGGNWVARQAGISTPLVNLLNALSLDTMLVWINT